MPHCGLAGRKFSTTIATGRLPTADSLNPSSPVSGLSTGAFVVVSVTVVAAVVVSSSCFAEQPKSVITVSIAIKTAVIFFIFISPKKFIYVILPLGIYKFNCRTVENIYGFLYIMARPHRHCPVLLFGKQKAVKCKTAFDCHNLFII